MDETIHVLGLTIQKNGSPEQSISERECHYLVNGACDQCTCDKCTGGLIIDKERGVARDCSCKVKAINRLRFKKTGLRAKDTFDSYIPGWKSKEDKPWQTAVKDAALSFVADKAARGFFAAGQSGAGKTHICTAIIQAIPTRGSIRIFRWASDALRIKALVNDPDRYKDELQPYKDADILYIDDLFKQDATDADIRLAFEIIDDRCNRGRVTIISSERCIDEIKKMRDGNGEAIAGRIMELCGEYCLNLSGSDKNQRFK